MGRYLFTGDVAGGFQSLDVTPNFPGADIIKGNSGVPTGNFLDRVRRDIGAKAREALVNLNQNILPNIPIFRPAIVNGNGNGVVGSSPAPVVETRQGGGMIMVILFAILGGFLLLRIFK